MYGTAVDTTTRRLQKFVSLSTTKAEYLALSDALVTIIWIQKIFK